ncbi:MAG TPA: hypothetical protein VN914_15490 [Polyangia bacterium]|nr:hypothetical protein [Polyangia bacterium]
MTRAKWLMAAFLMAGCGTEAPVPDNPTYVDDVKPILEANCFHCHGANANFAKWGTKRWDIYDATTVYPDLGFAPSDSFTGASDPTHFLLLGVYIKDTGAGRMPPPPATPLSQRDIDTLVQWSKTQYSPGKHAPNHKPRIAWLEKGKRYLVSDDDGDQVLGQLDCGGMMFPVLRSGSSELPADASPPCAATLYDGFDQGTGDLN